MTLLEILGLLGTGAGPLVGRYLAIRAKSAATREELEQEGDLEERRLSNDEDARIRAELREELKAAKEELADAIQSAHQLRLEVVALTGQNQELFARAEFLLVQIREVQRDKEALTADNEQLRATVVSLSDSHRRVSAILERERVERRSGTPPRKPTGDTAKLPAVTAEVVERLKHGK